MTQAWPAVSYDRWAPTCDTLHAHIQVLGKLAPAIVHEPEPAPEARPKTLRKSEGAVRIRGVDDLLVRFGKCCAPVPGDSIVGFITRGRGLTVHARDCLTVVKNVLDRERLVAVEWADGDPASSLASGAA